MRPNPSRPLSTRPWSLGPHLWTQVCSTNCPRAPGRTRLRLLDDLGPTNGELARNAHRKSVVKIQCPRVFGQFRHVSYTSFWSVSIFATCLTRVFGQFRDVSYTSFRSISRRVLHGILIKFATCLTRDFGHVRHVANLLKIPCKTHGETDQKLV